MPREDPEKKPKKEEKKQEVVEKYYEVPIDLMLINKKINDLTAIVNLLVINQQKIMEKLGIDIKTA